MSNTLKIIISTLTILSVLAVVIPLALLFGTRKNVDDYMSIPVIKLDKKYQTVVDKPSNYLAHPDMVLVNDKLITVYPAGHGKGAIITKTSSDFGSTWSERLTTTPKSWEKSQETPTIYDLKFTNGTSKLVLISGCPKWYPETDNPINGFNYSYSDNYGETWSEFENFYGIEWAKANNSQPYDAIVAMSSLTQLKENGVFVDKWMGTFHDRTYTNYFSMLTFDNNGKGCWSAPQRLLPEYGADEAKLGICEVEIIRTPDTNTLIMLGRTNTHISNSTICFSTDEGKTWTAPKILPNELAGERHKAEYDPTTGKLIISFRQLIPKVKKDIFAKQTFLGGNWVAWVGTFDDLMSYADDDTSNDCHGTAVLVLGSNNWRGGADTGYSGTVCKNGEFVLVSYGYFSSDAKVPFIMSVKFKLSDFGI